MKKLFSIIITLIIFILIFLNIDIKELIHYFSHMDIILCILNLLFFVPLFLVLAERWKQTIWYDHKLSLKESLKLVLASVTLNSFVPSKLGELSKAYFMKKNNKLPLRRGVNATLFEKVLDISSLIFWFLVGLLLITKMDSLRIMLIILSILILSAVVFYFFYDLNKLKNIKIFNLMFRIKKLRLFLVDTQEFIQQIKKNKLRLIYLIILSLISWLIQLIQIYYLFISFNYSPNITLVFGLVPIAIFVGLIPITIAGMGTRDAALIILFSEYAPASIMAGIGILVTARYWIASLLGLPFFKKYMDK